MNREQAEILVQQYFQSWLQYDLILFLSTLSSEVQITECYGPIYSGLEENRQWFINWHDGDGKGKVTQWDILQILYDEANNMAAVGWDFACIYNDNPGTFLGTSLIHFDDSKITSIQEYEMTKEQYRPYQT